MTARWFLYIVRNNVPQCPIQNMNSGLGECPAYYVSFQQHLEYECGVVAIIGRK